MKKILLWSILIIGLTGCTNASVKESANVKESETIKENEKEVEEETSNSYYEGTYYMVLKDGSLAKDGTGTVILNEDKSCAYYYGWSDFGCESFTVNDHTICLKTIENASDVCFTLDFDNNILIDANNEKYMKE